MRDIAFDLHDLPGLRSVCGQIRKVRLRARGKLEAAREIRLHMLRTRPPRRPHPVEQPPDRARQVFPLAPAAGAALLRRAARLPEQAAHRVPQETDIRRIVDVGLGHEGVAPPGQRRAGLFSRGRMAALHHQTVHRRQKLRTQKAHIVRQRLALVAMLVPYLRVAKELAQRHVLVHQLMEPVEIAAQTLLDHAHHKDPPHLHARTAHGPVGPGKNVLLQKREQPGTEMPVGVEMLKAQKQSRDVVPGLQVQLDVLDADLAEFHLRIANLSHDCPRRIAQISPDRARKGRKRPSSRNLRTRNSTLYQVKSTCYWIFWQARDSFPGPLEPCPAAQSWFICTPNCPEGFGARTCRHKAGDSMISDNRGSPPHRKKASIGLRKVCTTACRKNSSSDLASKTKPA